MESILIMLYALLALNTAELNQAVEEGQPLVEVARIAETGDDIRVEIQSIRSNF